MLVSWPVAAFHSIIVYDYTMIYMIMLWYFLQVDKVFFLFAINTLELSDLFADVSRAERCIKTTAVVKFSIDLAD